MILGLVRWLYDLLNGVNRPWQVGLGFAIGLATGLLPFGPLMLVGFVALLLINCHFGSGMLGFALGALLGLLIGEPVLWPLGDAVLTALHRDTVVWLATSDGWAALRLHENITVGAIIVGALLLVPVTWLVAVVTGALRRYVYPAVRRLPFVKMARRTWLFRTARWIFVG